MPLSLADVLSAQAGGGPVYEGGPDANVTPGGVLAALGSTWPARLGQDIVQGAMAPGNAYRSTPENPVTTEQMIGPAANLAMLMVGAPGGSGGVGSGARGSFTERMQEARDIAFERAQRGQATGDYGLGTAKRTAPEVAGTPEYSSDRLMSSLRDTQRQLSEYKNPPAKPLLAPGESPEDFSLFSGGNKTAGGLLGIRAYHGSPYDFEKFDLSKIGTGEGAQAYGHGLYFAENPATAQSYRDALAPGYVRTLNDVPVMDLPQHQRTVAQWMMSTGAKPSEIVPIAEQRAADARKYVGSSELERMVADEEIKRQMGIADAARELAKGPAVIGSRSHGRMYEVNINAEPGQFLNWDAPIAGHPAQSTLAALAEPVGRGFAERIASPTSTLTGSELYNSLTRKLSSGNAYLPSAEVRSQALQEAGIPGIRYLDQGSRNAPFTGNWRMTPPNQAAGIPGNWEQVKPTSNYVVFNPEIVDILKKYGLAGLTMGGVLTAAGQEPAPSQ